MVILSLDGLTPEMRLYRLDELAGSKPRSVAKLEDGRIDKWKKSVL
jgi:hypothetical protein